MAGLLNVEDFIATGLTRQRASEEVEKLVFGADIERCPKTGIPFERGIGALPREIQTQRYVRQLKEAGEFHRGAVDNAGS
jgi:hypothetical protein